MDSRTAAHTLTQISDLLELAAENKFKARAYQKAARAVTALNVEDLEPMLESGELAKIPGIGPATLSVIKDLVENGKSGYLETLKGQIPDDARERFGRKSNEYTLFYNGLAEAERLLANIIKHPKVERAEVAGSIRRRREIVKDVDIVVACRDSPKKVAESLERGAGEIPFDLYCVSPDEYGNTLWRQTGTEEHVNEVAAIIGKPVKSIKAADEKEIYKAAKMQFVPPELREGLGEIEAARAKKLPELIEFSDIKGIIHCHSIYSDGKASIEEMAAAAKSLGWSYIGISDHSQAAFYANGLKPDDVKRQHDEIDRLNEKMKGFKILKGIEADILKDGSLDYDEETKKRFDYIIGSIHNRFKMKKDAMTERILRAMDDPYLTILSHPTGRLLLSRDPFEVDMEAVFEKALKNGIAIEANGDPQRMDLDWRYIKRANELGLTIEIGPDAHSINALHNTVFGVNMARKGWTEAKNVLNTRSANEIIKFAKSRS